MIEEANIHTNIVIYYDPTKTVSQIHTSVIQFAKNMYTFIDSIRKYKKKKTFIFIPIYIYSVAYLLYICIILNLLHANIYH